jgi:hypothetical protein
LSHLDQYNDVSPAIQVEAEDKESLIKRNPHADFAAVEALRPLYNPSNVWTPSKTPIPLTDLVPAPHLYHGKPTPQYLSIYILLLAQ